MEERVWAVLSLRFERAKLLIRGPSRDGSELTLVQHEAVAKETLSDS